MAEVSFLLIVVSHFNSMLFPIYVILPGEKYITELNMVLVFGT